MLSSCDFFGAYFTTLQPHGDVGRKKTFHFLPGKIPL
jgi:hypothetical protein